VKISRSGSWSPWFWANVLAFSFSFGLLAGVSQLVDLLGAHGPTALGLAAHVSAIFAGGAVLGFLQQRTLNLSPLDKKRWLLTSPLAFAVSFICGEIAGGLFFGLTIAMTLFGLLSGFWQSLVFRNYSNSASWWILISGVGFTVAGLIAGALLFILYSLLGAAFLEAPVILSQGLIGAICGGVAGALTGSGLLKLPRK